MVSPSAVGCPQWARFATAARRIEALPFDGRLLLHAPASGALVLANRHAAELWRQLREGSPRPRAVSALAAHWQLDRRTAEAHVGRMLGEWERAGLLAGARRPAALARAARDDAAPAPVRYRLAGHRVDVRCDTPQTTADFDRVLAPLRAPSSAACADQDVRPATTVQVLGRPDGYVVLAAGRLVWGPADFAAARHVALRTILCAAVDDKRTAAVFHAAAAAVGDGAVLLIGNSGAGKTTLLAELLLAGARYVSDDLVALDRDGRSVWPFPVAVSLKPGSRALLEPRLRARAGFTMPPADAHGLSYVHVPATATASAPVPVRLVCFPRFDPHARALEVSPLPPAAALAQALASGTRIVGAPKRAEPLAMLLATVPAFALAYRRADDALRFIRDNLGERQCS